MKTSPEEMASSGLLGCHFHDSSEGQRQSGVGLFRKECAMHLCMNGPGPGQPGFPTLVESDNNVNLRGEGGTVTIMGPEEQVSYPPFLCIGDEAKSEPFTIKFDSPQ